MNTQQGKAALADFEDWLLPKMAEWHVPGMGLAVIMDDEVILERGFGLRDCENNLPVTPETQFAIGSVTKSFTAASCALMVDDGKLEWDQPVREILPTFRLQDEVAARYTSVRDMLAHRTGLPRHDLSWLYCAATRNELMARIPHLPPTHQFRARWQYQNYIYMAAGVVAGTANGTSWEDLVRTRLFAPLGMKTATFHVDEMQKYEDVARPYEYKNDEVRRMAYHPIDALGPAGSINASVREMIEWVRFQLNNGKVGEQQIISEESMRQMQRPQMVMDEPLWHELLGTEDYSYGLGWLIHNFHGVKLVQHGGNIDGFTALAAFIPTHKIGLIVLTNLNSNFLTYATAYTLFARLLGVETRDWHAHMQQLSEMAKAQITTMKEKNAANKKTGTQAGHPLADYAGDYHHPAYGQLSVSVIEDALQVTYNTVTIPLIHYHYEVFEGTYPVIEIPLTFQFETDLSGNVVAVHVPFEPTASPIPFKRSVSNG